MPEQGGTISLLPESRRKLEIKVPGENQPIYYGLGIVLVVILFFAGMKFYTVSLTSQLADIENEINTVETQRDKKFEQELLVLSKQFSLAGNLLLNHLIWSNVLINLQNLTSPQTQLKTIFGNTNDSKLEISGRAANYTTIAKQMAALFSNEAVIDISLDKISTFSTGVLEYNLRVFFNKTNFLLDKTSTK